MIDETEQINYVKILLASNDYQTIALQLQNIEHIYQKVSRTEHVDSSWQQSRELTNGIGYHPMTQCTALKALAVQLST
ncbi:MAG: hypothetical protein ACI935_001367 [Moritella dasanensis]|jgi:hypothetical protein